MKKNKIFFWFVYNLLVHCACFAQVQQNVNSNGYNKFYYDNGKVSSEGMMVNSKPDSYWKTYYKNGKIKSEGNRKNFELDSIWKFYNSEGKPTTEINYRNGKKEGVKKIWHEQNHILSEENYRTDIKSGFSYTYFLPKDSTVNKGSIKTKTFFDQGREVGQSFEYNEEGHIITIIEYDNGVMKKQEAINRVDKNGIKQGLWKDFYEGGKTKAETNYINGKKTGYFKSFLINGSLNTVEKYVGDSLQKEIPELTTKLETRNEYYEDGAIRKKGTYLYDLAEGIHKEYDREGKILVSKIHTQGNLVGEGLIDEAGNYQGTWAEYYSNGKLKGKGTYTNGNKTGEWVFYYINGKIEQKGKYDKKGKPIGTWQWFYESGNLLREENYINGKREGVLTEWSDSGKVITKGEYIEGLKEGNWFYQLQEYKEEGNYKNDLKDGIWESYYVDNNKLQYVGKFVEGLPDGKHTRYYHDGKKREEGKYIMGNKNDNWEYFNPDGTVLLTITFKNDKEIKFDGATVKPLLPGESLK